MRATVGRTAPPTWEPSARLAPEPSGGVGQHEERVLLLEDRIRFVSRPEVEHTAFPESPDTTAAEPFPSGPTLLKEHFVGLGNMEGLVIHLGLRDLELFGKSLSDRVVGLQDSDSAGVAVVAI